MITAALLVLAMTPGLDDTIFRGAFESDDACPEGRQTLADIEYDDGIAYAVDVTEWENIWGRASAFGDPVPWPGIDGSNPTILNFSKTGYLATKFHVPAEAPQNMLGWMTHTEYDYGQDLTASISASCGDFDAAAAQACYTDTTSGQVLVPWRVAQQGANFCQLMPGQDYYLNIRMTDPSRPSTTCPPTATACAISLQNNFVAP
jgi:hypothetical protein